MRTPFELIQYKQWVLWRKAEVNGRATKIPISPWTGKAAASDRPRTWSSYRHARYACHLYQCDGVGFVFTDADPFCGIDLDHCRDNDGTIARAALDWIKRFGSYAEISPSGTGVHILIKANLSGGGRRTGGVEMYDSGRYFTITGNRVPAMPLAILNRQDVLDQLSAEFFPIQPHKPSVSHIAVASGLSDDELIERAANARNSERFKRLWAGEISDYNNDHSRADLALCGMLAFWCGGDTDRIDRLFRRSGLMREKWDRRTGDSAYGSITMRATVAD